MRQDPIAFEQATARAMLEELTRDYAHGQIEIVGFPAARGAPVAPRHFPVDAIDEMLVHAARINARQGVNVYVGAARREGAPETGRASDEQVAGTRWIWLDLDDPGAAEGALARLAAADLHPTLLVTTGTVPHLRQQAFFRLALEIGPDRARALMRGMQRCLGGDPSVKNASRVMRLAGSFAWAKPDKPGRIDEVVTLSRADDPIGFHPATLERAFLTPAGTGSAFTPDGPAERFRFDTGSRSGEQAGPDEVREILSWIDPDAGGYRPWCEVLMALHDHFSGSDTGLAIADEWSRRGAKYHTGEVPGKWCSFDPGGGITFASVCALARQNGADLGDIVRRHRGRENERPARQGSGRGSPNDECAGMAGSDGTNVCVDIGPTPVHLTEDALAEAYASRHGRCWRYVPGWGQWLGWTGMLWQRDQTLRTIDLARTICREAANRAKADKVQAKLSSATTIAAVERLARSDRRHASTTEIWDRDPWLLNTPAGVVDLRRGDVRRHDPQLFMTKIAGASIGEDCPVWMTFLDTVTGGDAELQAYLKRMVGYCLTGATSEHALFFLYGTGANGKSVFATTLAAILGDYAAVAPMDMFMATHGDRHPTDMAGLRGARMVTSIETEQGSRWAESKLKALTGGDRITARFMRQDFFEFTPQFKLLIVGNHKPSIRNVDEAMRRRLHMVPFTVTIPPGERDPRLSEKLLAERDGILGWALAGCLEWQRTGLGPPEAVLAATGDYFEAEDAIGRWFEERCVLGPELQESSSSLFADWKAWADANGEYAGSVKRFAEALTARGFDRCRTSRAKGFRGLALAANRTEF